MISSLLKSKCSSKKECGNTPRPSFSGCDCCNCSTIQVINNVNYVSLKSSDESALDETSLNSINSQLLTKPYISGKTDYLVLDQMLVMFKVSHCQGHLQEAFIISWVRCTLILRSCLLHGPTSGKFFNPQKNYNRLRYFLINPANRTVLLFDLMLIILNSKFNRHQRKFKYFRFEQIK